LFENVTAPNGSGDFELHRRRTALDGQLGRLGIYEQTQQTKNSKRLAETHRQNLTSNPMGSNSDPPRIPFKVRLAAESKAQMTVTAIWIAERLGMATRGHLTHLLYRHGNSKAAKTTVRPE
jgi:hypothetical protein